MDTVQRDFWTDLEVHAGFQYLLTDIDRQECVKVMPERLIQCATQGKL